MSEGGLVIPETGDEESVEFHVPEETRINGMNYLLMTGAKENDEDGDCYILKSTSEAKKADTAYEFVGGDDGMDYLFKIFSGPMRNTGIDLKK